MVRKPLKFPPNFADLPKEVQDSFEEHVYKRQMAGTWGYGPDDPRLKSRNKIQRD